MDWVVAYNLSQVLQAGIPDENWQFIEGKSEQVIHMTR
jgi:hypothetical protein